MELLPLVIIWTLAIIISIFLWRRYPIQRDRLLIKGSRFVTVLVVVIIGFLALSILGAGLSNIARGDLLVHTSKVDAPLWWSTLYHFIDPGNQHMSAGNDAARIFSTIVGLGGVVMLNGLLVSALFSAFENRRDKWNKGEVRYGRHVKNHIVIVGGCDMVAEIVKHYIDHSDKHPRLSHPIVILTKRDVEEFRRELLSALGIDTWKLIIYYGNRTSRSDIAALNLAEAKEVFVLGEDPSFDEDETYHDTMNMQCIDHIVECTASRNDKLITHVMFEYQATFAALQVIIDDDNSHIDFCPFNYYTMWAQKVFHGDYHPQPSQKHYIPLDGSGIGKDSEEFVHLIVVGMSRMGEAVASTAAHLAHYPNFETKGKKTRITFISTDASQESFFFMERYPEMFRLARHRHIDISNGERYNEVEWNDPLNCENSPYGYLGGDFIDIEWEFINGYVEHPEVRRYLTDQVSNPQAKSTIAVCFSDNNLASAVAISLPEEVYHSAQQVLVYQRKGSELIDQISTRNLRYKGKLRAFGMVSQCYDWELMEEIANVGNLIDETYQFYTEGKVDKSKPRSASGWSNTYHSLTMRTKARSYGLDALALLAQKPLPTGDKNAVLAELIKDDSLRLLGQTEHNRWSTEQLMLGYRVLTQEEQKRAQRIVGMSAEEWATHSAARKQLKAEFAHTDICTNERLVEIDEPAVCFDILLTDMLLREYARRLSKGD